MNASTSRLSSSSKRGHGALLVLSVILVPTVAVSTTIRVDVHVVGGLANGTTWADAFPDLQQALAVAVESDVIWVAAGTYRRSGNDPTQSFILKEEVQMYGGFAGTEQVLSERNVDAYRTVLSGDLAGDDEKLGIDDNARHVVRAENVSSRTILDGFTITAGRAVGQGDDAVGGGLLSIHASPVIRKCRFYANLAKDGGGAVFDRAETTGGPTYDHVEFTLNELATDSGANGAAVLQLDSDAVYDHCRFLLNGFPNAVSHGGAVSVLGGTGGAFSTHGPTFKNCLFNANQSWDGGGALYAMRSTVSIVNCTFSNNESNFVNGFGGAAIWGVLSPITVTNSILRGNECHKAPSDEVAQLDSSGQVPTVDHSCVQGLNLLAGNGNVANASFIDPTGPDHIRGSPDDDFSLRPGSAAIDTGWTPSAAGPKDLAESDRVIGPAVDMGAFEAYGVLKVSESQATCATPWAGFVYQHLEDALSAASQDGTVREIWVAEGTYRAGPAYLGLNATFNLVSGVGVYGGFNGCEEARSQRSWTSHPTFLSGDVAGDDSPNPASLTDNVYHVVTSIASSDKTILAGFTISGGYARGTFGSPTQRGGGARLESSQARLRHIRFLGNRGEDGGAIHALASTATILDSVFSGNHASTGGAIYGKGSALHVLSDTFWHNTSDYRAGGIYCEGQALGNLPSVELRSSVLWGNIAGLVAGNYTTEENQLFSIASTAPLVRFCDVQGWSGPNLGDFGNFGGFPNTDDPKFVDPAGADGTAGTADDDLHLDSGSSCVDRGSFRDAEGVDLDGTKRFLGARPDVGAYERHRRVFVSREPPMCASPWSSPYSELRHALSDAKADSSITEIWVSEGTYLPDSQAKSVSFQIPSDLKVYGGFEGCEATLERDWHVHETVLSGDLLNNDGPDPQTLGDNSYHVLTAFDSSAQTVLDGLVIRGGNASGIWGNGYAAGMLLERSRLQVVNSRVEGNRADISGAGVFSLSSWPHFQQVTFANNVALHAAGGAMCNVESSPTIVASTFIGNSAAGGGAIWNDQDGAPRIESCGFYGNTAIPGFQAGGAIASTDWCRPVISNCVFSGNVSQLVGGGAVHVQERAEVTVTNSTFTKNSAQSYGAAISLHKAWLHLDNSILWGDLAPSASQEENELSVEQLIAPLFSGLSIDHTSIQGWTGLWGGAGNGAFDPHFESSLGCDGLAGTLDDNPRLGGGSPCIDVGDTSLVQSTLDFDGAPRVVNQIVDLGAVERAPHPRWYVRSNAWPGGDGRSWYTAFANLVTALAAAGPGDEVWVASNGLSGYKPIPEGSPPNRGYFFNVPTDVTLLGGFAACEFRAQQRDPALHETVLSGDQLNNDDFGQYGDNSYKVALADTGTVIDGFTIRSGRNDGPAPNHGGGLVISANGPVTVIDTVIGDNTSAGFAGGVYVQSGAPTFVGCTLAYNTADAFGGGVFVEIGAQAAFVGGTITGNSALWGGGVYAKGDLDLSEVAVTNNTATGYGGGLVAVNGTSTLTHCVVAGNSGELGGGLATYSIWDDGIGDYLNGHAHVARTKFLDNQASQQGGAVAAYSGDFTCTSCLMANNTAGTGGAIYNSCSMTLRNVTVADNTATVAGGGLYDSCAFPQTIQNSIFWDDTVTADPPPPAGQVEIMFTGPAPNVTYTDVEGIQFPGQGNLEPVDPSFLAWHPGTAVWDKAPPPNIPELDLDGHLRVPGNQIDLGCYEEH